MGAENRSDSQRGRQIIVYADYREERSGIPELIEAEGVPVVRKNLAVGDYIISNEIVVERKSAYDFAHSLFDGRLFDQARRMAETYPQVYIIVEGDPARLRRYRGRERQLYAAIVALVMDYGARIIYSGGPGQTAYIIASIARRAAQEGRHAAVLRKKAKLESVSDWQLFILQSFPGVGEKTARRIMERFRSLRDFCNAPKSELARIEGIGEKRADLIITILNRRFDYAPRNPRRVTLEDFYRDNGSG